MVKVKSLRLALLSILSQQRTVASISFYALLLGVLLNFAPMAPHVQAATYWEVTQQPINLRTGPGKKYRVVGKMKKGQIVSMSKQKGSWARIEFPNSKGKPVIGWMHKRFLRPASVEQTAAKEAAGKADKPVTSAVADKPIKSNAKQVVEQKQEKKSDIKAKLEAIAKAKAEATSAKAISGNINCIRSPSTDVIGGCVIDLDLTVIGPHSQSYAEVTCEADLLLTYSDGSHIEDSEVKRIRTPLKRGKGAARMQMMLLPMTQIPLSDVSISDYRCLANS